MSKCSNCGAELDEGAKFCMECGTPVPQVKKCIQCGMELPLKARFCFGCGAPQAGGVAGAGVSMGDKNVVAGDVIGQKVAGDNVQSKIMGNAIYNTILDDTKRVNCCHVCGKHLTNDNGHTCPRCGKIVCEECFDKQKRCCENCLNAELEKQQETESAKKAALEAEKAERAKTLFTDPRDGNTYKLVKIGNQIWFAENFRFDCGEGCFHHEKGESMEITKKYGLLYTWDAAVDFCPEGFHLPTKEEWLELFGFLVTDSDDSLSLAKKMITANGWTGRNTSGFNAKPSGFIARNLLDDCDELNCYHEQACFWCSTKADDNGIHFDFDGESIEQGRNEFDGGLRYIAGLSVRYIKDEIDGVEPIHAAKVAVCADCKKIIKSINKVECPKCGKMVCQDCFVLAEDQCSSCKRKKEANLRKKLQREKEVCIQAEADRKRAEMKARLPDNQGYFVDPRDGIAYKVVKIGNQVWFAENFRNENRDFVDSEGTQNSKEYGYFYSQDCAKKLAPKGWRLPSERDFKTLLSYVKENGSLQQDSGNEGGALPLMACDKWNRPATDEFGFSALPAGFGNGGSVNAEDEDAYFWTSNRGIVLHLNGFVASADIEDYSDGDLDVFLSVRYIKEDSFFSKTLEEAQKVARGLVADQAKLDAEEKFAE